MLKNVKNYISTVWEKARNGDKQSIGIDDLPNAALSIGQTRYRLSRFKARLRHSITQLPDSNEEELFIVTYVALDQVLTEACFRCLARDVAECYKYIATAQLMLTSAEKKLDHLLQKK